MESCGAAVEATEQYIKKHELDRYQSYDKKMAPCHFGFHYLSGGILCTLDHRTEHHSEDASLVTSPQAADQARSHRHSTVRLPYVRVLRPLGGSPRLGGIQPAAVSALPEQTILRSWAKL